MGKYVRIPIVFVTPAWLMFLHQAEIPFREVARYQVGQDCFRDFRSHEVVYRVEMTAECWQEDSLSDVLPWIEFTRKERNNRVLAITR